MSNFQISDEDLMYTDGVLGVFMDNSTIKLPIRDKMSIQELKNKII